jgi:hypothetical protein
MLTRKTGSETSARLASLAGRALRDPASVTHAEIRELAGSVLEQHEPPTIPIRPRLGLGEALGRLDAFKPPKKP